jgi:hypothetical protein
METIILLLTFSLLLNLLLFRWGWSERRDRRVWQQEATVLQRALRDHAGDTRITGKGSLAPLFVLGGLLLTFTLMALFNA